MQALVIEISFLSKYQNTKSQIQRFFFADYYISVAFDHGRAEYFHRLQLYRCQS